MNDQYTPTINESNVSNIRQQIAMKTGYMPYHSTGNHASQVTTDYDTFPYKRWWRGVPDSEIPIVAEREAGVRRQKKHCYTTNTSPITVPYPNHCFSTASNVSFPCYPEYLKKHSDRAFMDTVLNKACLPLNYR